MRVRRTIYDVQADEHKGLCVQAPFNIGIMLWRNTAISRVLLQEWVTNLKAVGGVGYMAEQLELNQILRGKDGSRLFPLQPVLDSDVRDRLPLPVKLPSARPTLGTRGSPAEAIAHARVDQLWGGLDIPEHRARWMDEWWPVWRLT